MFSILVAIEIYKSRKHSLLSIKKELANCICEANNINLKGFEITGQSLLTKDATSNWKFAHKSIYEFYIAKYALENIDFGFGLDITGMDMTKKFLDENDYRTLLLYNYSIFSRNETFLEKLNEKRKQTLDKNSINSIYYISNFLVSNADYKKVTGEDLALKYENIISRPPKSILSKFTVDYLSTNSNCSTTINKTQAINYCNKLNEILGYKIYYNEAGKLVDETGKKIKNITEIRGFRFPTINEIEKALEKQNQLYKKLLEFEEEERKTKINKYSIHIEESKLIRSFEWSHEEIGSNDDSENVVRIAVQKKSDNLRIRNRHYMRLVFIN